MSITIRQPQGNRSWRPEDIEAPEPLEYEIVDGNLVLMMWPQKSLWHQALMHELAQVLKEAAPAGYKGMQELTVGYFRPGAVKETLREPDVLVLRPGAKARLGNVFDPRDVVLAVEVESPSTRAVDRAEGQLPDAAALSGADRPGGACRRPRRLSPVGWADG